MEKRKTSFKNKKEIYCGSIGRINEIYFKDDTQNREAL